ncbi:unnamed protein product, partial [Laminaria digitata]
LNISATIEPIDGVGGFLGFAGPTRVRARCPTISFEGEMTFDVDDIESLENDGKLEAVVLHEMGHVIGLG